MKNLFKALLIPSLMITSFTITSCQFALMRKADIKDVEEFMINYDLHHFTSVLSHNVNIKHYDEIKDGKPEDGIQNGVCVYNVMLDDLIAFDHDPNVKNDKRKRYHWYFYEPEIDRMISAYGDLSGHLHSGTYSEEKIDTSKYPLKINYFIELCDYFYSPYYNFFTNLEKTMNLLQGNGLDENVVVQKIDVKTNFKDSFSLDARIFDETNSVAPCYNNFYFEVSNNLPVKYVTEELNSFYGFDHDKCYAYHIDEYTFTDKTERCILPQLEKYDLHESSI